MSEFQRSNLTIQPKQRLMSAGSFINPVRTYDANEQMRIVESFRGLSTQSDALIDGFIKKKQEEGQKLADQNFTEALENSNHPDHKKATDLMEKQKKEVAKFPNLLSTSYWAQQYLFEAQAEQVGMRERWELQDLADKSVNLSPAEYAKQAGAVRKKFEEEIGTFPDGVQRAFYRLPREQTLLTMQDRHFQKVATKNDEMLDVVLANKFRSTILNNYDGLDTVFQNATLSNDVVSLPYGDLTQELKTKLKDAETLYKRVTGRTVGYDMAKGEIVDIEDRDTLYTYAVIAESNQPDILISQMVEAANAGRTPNQIHTQLTNTIKELIQEYPDMQEELEALYLITIDKANSNSVLQEKVKSWTVTDSNTVWHDKDIALFDIGQSRVIANEFKGVAVNAANLQRANDLRQEQKNYKNGLKFLWDLRDAGKLDDDYIMNTPVAQIAKDRSLSVEKFGDAITDYQKSIQEINAKPYSQRHFDNYNAYLEDIRHGRIASNQVITNAYKGGVIHGKDYKALMDEFDTHGGNNGAKARSLINPSVVYAEEYIDQKIGLTNSTLAINAKKYLKTEMWNAYNRGEITSELEGYEVADKILQRMGNIIAFKGLFTDTSNVKANELQTPQQLKGEFVSQVSTGLPAQETGQIEPVYYLRDDATLDAFTRMLNEKTGLNYTKEEIIDMYNSSMQLSKDKRYNTLENKLTTMLKSGNYSIQELTLAVKERPDLVKEITGIEFVISEDGKPIPKDEKQAKAFRIAISKGYNMKKSLQYIDYYAFFN